MEQLLIKSHRYVSGYIPGSNLGMNILTQLLTKKGYDAQMFQGYAKEALDYVKELMGKEDKPKIIGFYCDLNNIHWVKTFSQEVKKRFPEVVLLAGGPQTAGMDVDFLNAQLGKNDEDAIVHRTFELWLYTDISEEQPRIFDEILDETDYTILKLCKGKEKKPF